VDVLQQGDDLPEMELPLRRWRRRSLNYSRDFLWAVSNYYKLEIFEVEGNVAFQANQASGARYNDIDGLDK